MAPTLKTRGLGAAAYEKASCSGASPRPGGIAGKIPPAPLTTAETPLRVLAGMAPTLTWGGARPNVSLYCSEKAGCTNCKESNTPRGYAPVAQKFLGPFFGPVSYTHLTLPTILLV